MIPVDNKPSKGDIQTVSGIISPNDLGATMTHEHLLIDFTCMFSEPEDARFVNLAYQPVDLTNLGWVRYHSYMSRDNLLLDDVETAIREASFFKHAGGGTIVDVTTYGIGRDPLGLKKISQIAGINVISGAGFYVNAVHPENMDELSESYLSEKIANEVLVGIDGTDIRAGIIGEIGCTWPLHKNERKVLRAAAIAQKETGAPILIHPGRNPKAPSEILNILSQAGADISHTVMGHLDRTISEVSDLLEIANSGCYLEYDLFGNETSYYALGDIVMPNDAQRMEYISALISNGFGEKIVVSHDICHKHSMSSYGGHGYSHILENIAPRMAQRGFTKDQINAIIIENPARLLTFS